MINTNNISAPVTKHDQKKLTFKLKQLQSPNPANGKGSVGFYDVHDNRVFVPIKAEKISKNLMDTGEKLLADAESYVGAALNIHATFVAINLSKETICYRSVGSEAIKEIPLWKLQKGNPALFQTMRSTCKLAQKVFLASPAENVDRQFNRKPNSDLILKRAAEQLSETAKKKIVPSNTAEHFKIKNHSQMEALINKDANVLPNEVKEHAVINTLVAEKLINTLIEHLQEEKNKIDEKIDERKIALKTAQAQDRDALRTNIKTYEKQQQVLEERIAQFTKIDKNAIFSIASCLGNLRNAHSLTYDQKQDIAEKILAGVQRQIQDAVQSRPRMEKLKERLKPTKNLESISKSYACGVASLLFHEELEYINAMKQLAKEDPSIQMIGFSAEEFIVNLMIQLYNDQLDTADFSSLGMSLDSLDQQNIMKDGVQKGIKAARKHQETLLSHLADLTLSNDKSPEHLPDNSTFSDQFNALNQKLNP